MQRVHLIALADKIRQAGQKGDLYPPVAFPDFPCQFHAVHLGHLDIQQENIPKRLFLIRKKKAFRIGIG